MSLPSLKRECVIAFDPGETTGVAVVSPTGGGGIGDYATMALPWEDVLRRVASDSEFFPGWGPKTMVCENFRLYPGMAKTMINNEFRPVRVLGYLELYALRRGTPIRYQMAAQAKAYFGDTKLKELGAWAKSDHERDALRHAYYYLAFGKEKGSA